MSFATSRDLEANDPDSLFNVLIEDISGYLFKINNNVNSISKFTGSLNSRYSHNQVGKTPDSLELRILELVASTSEAFKELNKSREKLVSNYTFEHTLPFGNYRDEDQVYFDEGKIKISKNQNLQREKIIREISDSLKRFQDSQEAFKLFIENLESRAALLEDEAVTSEFLGRENDASGLKLPQQTLIKELDPINNEELVYHTQLVTQRGEEIQHIEESISELNTIFKDLDTLVSDQGFAVDNIENSINNYSASAKGAQGELTKADKYQRRSLKTKKCLILVCTVIIVALMIIVLALT